ncbi:MAG: ATP-binding cassette domain-containing protein [Treponema sp.]|nr:ATP-binding cassette domain-containing protein [Treponema sp.]
MSLTVSIRKRISAAFSLNVHFECGPDSTERPYLGILGPSGSGKSLTLKCIAGIETPDEGYITLNGRTLFDSVQKINLRPQARRVGYLFQNYALFPHMTVMENICVGLQQGRSGSKVQIVQKARYFIERFELSGMEDRLPRQLSGGQQQRAALARMIIREPELVLLDEPFSALDASLREQMSFQLPALIEPRQDVILVTHNRDEVFNLCGRTLVIDSGAVLACNETGALFRNPGTVRLAVLTGCKNIAPCTRTGEREIEVAEWGLRLRTAAPVPADVTHAGIRAHDFRPAAGEDCNLIIPAVIAAREEPFERLVVFTNAASPSAEQGRLWWKFSKYQGTGAVPERLFIPPEAVLLLRSRD